MEERKRPEHNPEKYDPKWPEPKVSCTQCLREVPETEAVVREAQDYVLYFCGRDCFEVWQRRAGVEDK